MSSLNTYKQRISKAINLKDIKSIFNNAKKVSKIEDYTSLVSYMIKTTKNEMWKYPLTNIYFRTRIDLHKLLLDSVKYKNIEAIKLLRKDPKSKIEINKNEVLTEAILTSNIKIVNMILTHPNVILNDSGAMGDAIVLGNLDIIKLLLDNPKSNIDSLDIMVGVAIGHSDFNISLYILNRLKDDKRLNPNLHPYVNMLLAARTKDPELIDMFLSKSNIQISNKILLDILSNRGNTIYRKIVLKAILEHSKVMFNPKLSYNVLNTIFKFYN